jgi:hypothetical protein
VLPRENDTIPALVAPFLDLQETTPRCTRDEIIPSIFEGLPLKTDGQG